MKIPKIPKIDFKKFKDTFEKNKALLTISGLVIVAIFFVASGFKPANWSWGNWSWAPPWDVPKWTWPDWINAYQTNVTKTLGLEDYLCSHLIQHNMTNITLGKTTCHKDAKQFGFDCICITPFS